MVDLLDNKIECICELKWFFEIFYVYRNNIFWIVFGNCEIIVLSIDSYLKLVIFGGCLLLNICNL